MIARFEVSFGEKGGWGYVVNYDVLMKDGICGRSNFCLQQYPSSLTDISIASPWFIQAKLDTSQVYVATCWLILGILRLY